MHIFHRFKKILLLSIITLLFAYFCVSVAASQDGMKIQANALSNVVSVYIDNFFNSGKKAINIADLGKKVQEKAVSLGLDLVFKCAKEGNNKYVLCGHNRLTNDRVSKIVIDDVFIGATKSSCSISSNLDPNHDGCLKSAEDGNLFINTPLETVFSKVNNCVDIASEKNFAAQDKNVYKVIQYPSLVQERSGPCGYYAINNILLAYNGLTSVDNLLDRNRFEPFYDKLISYNSGKFSGVSNLEISKIIKNNLKELYKPNIIISIESINNLNCLSDTRVMTFGSEKLEAGEDRIRDFQINGTPQYLIVGTSEKGCNESINGLYLDWDNSYDRLYCVEDHWIVLKIEWQDESRPGACPVILSVFDSSGTKDNRFATLIHWYYYIFTHTLV